MQTSVHFQIQLDDLAQSVKRTEERLRAVERELLTLRAAHSATTTRLDWTEKAARSMSPRMQTDFAELRFRWDEFLKTATDELAAKYKGPEIWRKYFCDNAPKDVDLDSTCLDSMRFAVERATDLSSFVQQINTAFYDRNPDYETSRKCRAIFRPVPEFIRKFKQYITPPAAAS
jgi:hypothetical protein